MSRKKQREGRREGREPSEETRRSAEKADRETAPESAPEEQAEAEPDQQRTAAQPSEATPAEERAEEGVDDDAAGRLKAAEDKYIRLLAEFDNFKRRTSREYERMVEAANEGLMLDMTEVRENFERALKAAHDKGDTKSLIEGMRLIFSRFDEILGKHGLEPFGEEGDEFDPALHDAMMKMAHGKVAEDHIAQVIERGYRLRGHVIKHARVVVSAGPPEEETVQAPDDGEKRTEDE